MDGLTLSCYLPFLTYVRAFSWTLWRTMLARISDRTRYLVRATAFFAPRLVLRPHAHDLCRPLGMQPFIIPHFPSQPAITEYAPTLFPCGNDADSSAYPLCFGRQARQTPQRRCRSISAASYMFIIMGVQYYKSKGPICRLSCRGCPADDGPIGQETPNTVGVSSCV
ncbi:hypothetical protein ARMGADRAFT_1014736 [Armillaria gallica]|uniref:Uncharacterized protein n=1 Tax=Armillaria gallica TaxID=47427 RepID=A0A2H3DF88_ARMGA|nr:hypothetical protein ARMGADRAFT_1014736 [Armillaria gallica]